MINTKTSDVSPIKSVAICQYCKKLDHSQKNHKLGWFSAFLSTDTRRTTEKGPGFFGTKPTRLLPGDETIDDILIPLLKDTETDFLTDFLF